MRLVLVIAIAACGGSPKPAPAPLPEGAEHHRPHTMVHRFDDAEKWAKVFDDPERDAWQHPDEVIAALEMSPSLVIADVGAGTGYFTVKLAKALPTGTAIAQDIEPNLIAHVQERARREGLANLQTVLGTADDPKLAAGSVDRILVVDTWHHLGDRPAFAKKLASAMKPMGLLVVVDFKLDASRGPPKHHRLAPEAVVAELNASGFAASVHPSALPDQYIVRGIRK